MLSSVRWFVDSGHGWLRVPLVSAEGLRFSEFSYIDRAGGWLYLEEDCDAGVWLRAHDLRGSAFGVVDFDGDCFVRDLPRVVVGVRS
jgi:hypothetical protein